MREKFMRFMYGRYGVDTLSKFLVGVALVIYLISSFTQNTLLYYLSWAFMIVSYFRIFSRNVYKRANENQQFLNRTVKIRTFFNTKIRAYINQKVYMFNQRKTHHIYKCPTCSQKIRIPRGKGRVEIRCPKCNSTFIKRS